MPAKKPDVVSLMKEIDEAAAQIRSSPAGKKKFIVVPPNESLERDWDVFRFDPPPSHRRGLAARAIRLAKTTTLRALRPLAVEVLRRQRDYNHHVKGELSDLRRAVLRLQAQVEELKEQGKSR